MPSSAYHVCLSDLLGLYECMQRTNQDFATCERVYAKLHKCVKLVSTMQAQRSPPAVAYPPYAM
jgi:hypothetical protein